jgi:hypothetical protein
VKKNSLQSQACLNSLQEYVAVHFLHGGILARKDTKKQINKKNPALSSAFTSLDSFRLVILVK